jgi:asparagine synthase (glutamine-hydrolysing)
MNTVITHRGPDDHGEYRSPEGLVSLAMRRLSIIDLQSGHQPMSNADGSIWIVFNGEIFNAPEIRPGLERCGHRFVTSNSDTEVLLHLYEEKGPAALEDLNGMFAFVIHDKKRHVLLALAIAWESNLSIARKQTGDLLSHPNSSRC